MVNQPNELRMNATRRSVIILLVIAASCQSSALLIGGLEPNRMIVEKDLSKPERLNFFLLGGNPENWNGAYISIDGYLYGDGKDWFLAPYPSDLEHFSSRLMAVLPEKGAEDLLKKMASKDLRESAPVQCSGYYQSGWRGHGGVFFGELSVNKIHAYKKPLLEDPKPK